MDWFWIGYTVVAWIIRAGMVPVVLRKQLATSAALAWLGIVFLHPYIGLALYLLLGEKRLGPLRTEVHRKIIQQFRSRREGVAAAAAEEVGLHPIYQPMALQAEKISGLPIRPGNCVEFLGTLAGLVDRLVADIDAATQHVHLLYYIFQWDKAGERVAEALERAAGRGVACRVLVDAVASRAFFRGAGLGGRLTAAKVHVAAAMPVTALRRRGLPRMDLRNHRKLAVIDDRVAYAGSHNLIDPDYGGRCGGPWVDLTGRYRGPIVQEFQGVFCEDWAFETGEFLTVAKDGTGPPGASTAVQVVPTGPSAPGETFRRLLLAAIQCARSQVILTTPYFVPDEPMLIALMMAADRGVNVKVLVPKTPDHFFTAAAGRAHFSTLMESGVQIFLYQPGMMHSKTASVDEAFSIVGSANIDLRSFNLNFELSVLIYGAEAVQRVRAIQTEYLNNSSAIDAKEWAARPTIKRYADGAISLLSPLL